MADTTISTATPAAQAKVAVPLAPQSKPAPTEKVVNSGEQLAQAKKTANVTFSELKTNLDQAIVELNKAMKHKQVEATISHDKTSNRYVVSITDKASGEVIRQVPSEAIQQFARNLEGLKGVLFDAML